MKKSLLVFGILILILLIVASIFLFNKPEETGAVTQNIETVPLTSVERQAIVNTILKTEFIKDIPEDEPVAIIFYDFETGERRFRDGFLVNNKGFLSEGTPTIYIYVHSKYIDELEQGDLCSVISQANKKGDLATYSDYSNARLLLKYSGMLKYKNCLGL